MECSSCWFWPPEGTRASHRPWRAPLLGHNAVSFAVRDLGSNISTRLASEACDLGWLTKSRLTSLKLGALEGQGAFIIVRSVPGTYMSIEWTAQCWNRKAGLRTCKVKVFVIWWSGDNGLNILGVHKTLWESGENPVPSPPRNIHIYSTFYTSWETHGPHLKLPWSWRVSSALKVLSSILVTQLPFVLHLMCARTFTLITLWGWFADVENEAQRGQVTLKIKQLVMAGVEIWLQSHAFWFQSSTYSSEWEFSSLQMLLEAYVHRAW